MKYRQQWFLLLHSLMVTEGTETRSMSGEYKTAKKIIIPKTRQWKKAQFLQHQLLIHPTECWQWLEIQHWNKRRNAIPWDIVQHHLLVMVIHIPAEFGALLNVPTDPRLIFFMWGSGGGWYTMPYQHHRLFLWIQQYAIWCPARQDNYHISTGTNHHVVMHLVNGIDDVELRVTGRWYDVNGGIQLFCAFVCYNERNGSTSYECMCARDC